jgi:hypothetical protein
MLTCGRLRVRGTGILSFGREAARPELPLRAVREGGEMGETGEAVMFCMLGVEGGGVPCSSELARVIETGNSGIVVSSFFAAAIASAFPLRLGAEAREFLSRSERRTALEMDPLLVFPMLEVVDEAGDH